MKLAGSALLAGVIIVAAAFVGGEMTAGVRASHSLAAYRDSLRRADVVVQQRDSALQVARSHTDVATRTVTRFVIAVNADSGWRHDTVRVAGDTTPRYAVPIPVVLLQDSLNRACSELAVTCQREREAAIADRDAVQHKLDVALARPERSCAHAFWWGTAAGAAGDEAIHGRIQVPLLNVHF